MAYGGVQKLPDGSWKQGNQSVDYKQKMDAYAASQVLKDKFICGIYITGEDKIDELRPHVAVCRSDSVGFGAWTVDLSSSWKNVYGAFKKRWSDIGATVNPSGPEATFKNQPKQTPQWFLDHLNEKSPPAP